MKVIKTASFNVEAQQSWGRAGAGIMFVCRQDNTAMLLLRSMDVEDPEVWGMPGGAVKGTEGYHDEGHASQGMKFSKQRLWKTAYDETMEEIGMFPKDYKAHPHPVVFDTNPSSPNSFKYYTFVVDIPITEKQNIEEHHQLNWENNHLMWYPIQTLMAKVQSDTPHPEFEGGRLHRGVAHALDNHPALNMNAAPLKPNSRKPKQV